MTDSLDNAINTVAIHSMNVVLLRMLEREETINRNPPTQILSLEVR